jgi:uncharacterized protein (TIGR03118 family)
MRPIDCRLALIAIVLFIATSTTRGGDVYVQTNLVSNIPGMAELTDPNLQGAWGLSSSVNPPNTEFWVSNNASDTSTLYSVSPTTNTPSILSLVVPVPNQGGAAPNQALNGPTGQVSTTAAGITTSSTNDFQINNGTNSARAAFIFANVDGSISGWRGGNAVIQTVVPGASFTGLAIGNLPGPGGAAQLYAADQNSGNIDVINSKWQTVGSFKDPNFGNFPTGYAAFNVQNLNVNGTQTLFVTYANQSTTGGIVDEFSTNGTFIKTLIDDTAGTHLSAPWGLAIAPAGWGQFGGDLLVGNNNPGLDGNTEINAYNLTTGAYEGTLMLNTGLPFSETELWALSFGTGGSEGGSTNTLFFTAGLDGNTNGLFGSITVSSVPEPSSAVIGLIAIAIGAFTGCWKLKNRQRLTVS